MFAETSARAVKCSVHLNRGLVVWLCEMAEHKNWEEVYQCNQVRSTIYTFSGPENVTGNASASPAGAETG